MLKNSIKYNPNGSENNALNKGNWWIGTGDVNKHPTSSTGFYRTITPNGYAIYSPKPSGEPSVHVLNSDNELIKFTNRFYNNNFTTVAECLNYYANESDLLCQTNDFETIITDNLFVFYDASKPSSHPKMGDKWFDLSPNKNNGILNNGIFNNDNGSLVSGESNSYIYIEPNSFSRNDPNSPFSPENTDLCLSIWFKPKTIQSYSTNHNTHNVIFANAGDNFDDNFELGFTKNTIDIYTELKENQGLNNGKEYTINTSISEDNWYNLVINKSADFGIKTYKNNVLIDTDPNAKSKFIPSSGFDYELSLFASLHVDTFFNGLISVLLLYNRALFPAEIDQNFQVMRSRFGI
jgi:hypothetical protein